jgi:predicted ATPase
MIQSLRLERFKNFQDATLKLGPLTVLIGANASGKSNIRDAFSFLHGIGRGYNLAEILGEKYVGGERVWNGIRGGTREVAYSGADSFGVGLDLKVSFPKWKNPGPFPVKYTAEIKLGSPFDKPPQVFREALEYNYITFFKFKDRIDKNSLKFVFWRQKGVKGAHPPTRAYYSGAPILCQVAEDEERKVRTARNWSKAVLQQLESFRFLDLSPSQMRIPSLPGQTTLGDRGENLSSVLLAICEDAPKKEALLEWVRKLTPMDVDDLYFERDAAGRILLNLKERNGRRISALSASDGTLRFLGVLAALFGPKPASFYFIEELENGIHPTRLGLLVDLIESQTKRQNIQVIATSHSSLLLQFLSEDALANASIVYRLPDQPNAQIKRILDIPGARRVIKEQGVSLLHASSWFEDALDYTEDSETESIAGSQKT